MDGVSERREEGQERLARSGPELQHRQDRVVSALGGCARVCRWREDVGVELAEGEHEAADEDRCHATAEGTHGS